MLEKSFIDEPTRPAMSTRKKRIPNMTMSKASNVGTRLFCSQKRGGELIIEMNAANKKGTIMVLAALIPAITTTKAAIIISIWAAFGVRLVFFMAFFFCFMLIVIVETELRVTASANNT